MNHLSATNEKFRAFDIFGGQFIAVTAIHFYGEISAAMQGMVFAPDDLPELIKILYEIHEQKRQQNRMSSGCNSAVSGLAEKSNAVETRIENQPHDKESTTRADES